MCPLQTPLPLGKPETKVKVSDGPSHDIMNFYHTRYSSEYVGNGNSGIKLKNRGTGYASNIRPVVLFDSEVDKEENPYMFDVHKSMYNTVTKLDYQKYGNPEIGKFPGQLIPGVSSYVRDVKSHTVGKSDMQKLWHNGNSCEPCPDRNRHRPQLYKVHHAKSAIPQCYDDTEYRVKYQGSQLPSDLSLLNTKSIGCIEPTGHVKNQNIEPITYKPKGVYTEPQPYIGNYSIYQTTYQPFAANTGLEHLPALAPRSDTNTGNTRENMDTHPPFIPKEEKDKCRELLQEAMSMEGKSNYITPKYGDYKEESGAVINRSNHISIHPGLGSKNPWQTHYMATHTDPTPKGKDREGHTRGGVQPPWEDGFTKSTQWTKFPPDEEPSLVLKRMHPTVARSIIAENPSIGHPLYQKPGEVPVC